MPKSKSAPAPKAGHPPAPRPLSGAALKAQQAKAAKALGAAAKVGAEPHQAVVLTGDFETDTGGARVFRAGPHHLPPHLATEARAKGLVAPDAE